MASVWQEYGITMATPCQTLAKLLPSGGANIKVAVGVPELIVKKVKNEHGFIGLRT